MNVVLKSGTNALHGSAYEFNSVSALTATPFFNNSAGQKKANAIYNQYGMTGGGPVVLPKIFDGRNKLFFYAAWEKMFNIRSAPTFATVPTAAERTGDLSALLKVSPSYQIYNPFSGTVEGARIRRQPFPGNIIPPSMVNPIAQNYLRQFYHDPNVAGRNDGLNNFYAGQNGERTGYNNELGRLDWNISDRHKIFGNVRRNIRIGSGANSLGDAISSISSGTGTIRTNWGMMVDDVYTFSPTLLLNTRLNWTRYSEDTKNYSYPFDSTSLGFPKELADVSQRKVLPRIQMDTFTGVGASAGGPNPFDTYQIFTTITKIAGGHSIKIGADLRQYRDSQTDYGLASGTYTFSTNWTRGPLDNATAAPLGQDLAAFLLGLPTGGNFDVNSSRTNKAGYYAFFFQDDYRVQKNLVLNLGLRWERETATTERYNRTTNGFDFTTPSPVAAAAMAAYVKNPIPEIPASQFKVNGGLLFAGPNNRELYTTSSRAFSPRFGFAWTPAALGSKTVFRGGTGVFFLFYGITGFNQYGFNQSNQLVATLDGYLTPAVTLSNPFPNGISQPVGAANGLSTFLGQQVAFSNPHLAQPYSIRWNFDIQHELGKNLVLQVGYMGNHAVHLPSNVEINAAPAQYLSNLSVRDQAVINNLTANVPNPFAGLIPGQTLNGSTVQKQQLLRPFPQFTGITRQMMNEGSSYFHLLDVRLEKRYSKGLTFLASYGYSKQIERIARLNPTDPVPEKRIGSEDRPHRLVASGSYELPFGSGKPWLARGGVVNQIVGGWITTGTYTLQSGPALNWGNVIYYGGDIHLDPHNVDHAFDTTRFNTNSSQQLANNIRSFPTRFGNLRSDGVNQWDLSAIKNFGIKERAKLQYRCEFFNAFNHPRFDAPNLTPTSTSFAVITTQAQDNPRAIQMALRLVF